MTTDDSVGPAKSRPTVLADCSTTTSRFEIVAGSGRRVVDGQGRSYLDFFGGVLTNMLGYDIRRSAPHSTRSWTRASCTRPRST